MVIFVFGALALGLIPILQNFAEAKHADLPLNI
jgi:hypothetical protein